MPKVNGKHYDYSPKGIAMAKNDAEKKSVKVQYKKHGGAIKTVKCRGGGAATQGLEFKMKD
tara:strand:- start:1035 stop:1217 length:183 start_codon:yes stop_codon:yes gene_type:complete